MSEPKRSVSQRRSFRRQPKGSTEICCRKGSWGLGPEIGESLLNISEDGICMILKEELQLQEEVEISLCGPGCYQGVKRVAHVVWCVATADGNYCVGMEFEKHLDYAVLQELCLLPERT